MPSKKTKSWSVRIAQNMVWARIQIVRREKAAIAAMNLAWEREARKIPGILAGTPPTKNLRSLSFYMSSEELSPLVDRYAAAARLEIRAGMLEVTDLNYELTEKALKDKAPWLDSAFPAVAPSKETAAEILSHKYMGKDLEAWNRTMTPKTVGLFQKELMRGYMAGDSIASISRGIKSKFDLTRDSSLAMTRTAIMGAANRAQEIAWETHKDVIKGYVHLSTLDMRTCPKCGALDGKYYSARQRRPGLPLHVACRCTYSPVPRSYAELGLGPAQVPDPAFRASMDGEKPGQMKYPDFFRGLDREKQTAILGSKVKYDRWKAGTWKPEFLKEDFEFEHVCALEDYELFYEPPETERTIIEEIWRRN